jgi:predicted ATPase
MNTAPATSTWDGPAQQWSFYGQPTAFVGRVKELHRLREAQRSAIEAGRRRAVVLLGPPGIGKSRLMAEFCGTIEEHVDRVTVLNVACLPDGGPPYSLYQRLLRERFYVQRDDPPETARARIQHGLSQVLRDEVLGEEAAHFIGHMVGLRFPRSKHILKVDADPRRIEERAIELFRQVLHTDAMRTPLMVCIDNLHLASEESLSLLLKLAHGLDDAPVLFIGAARPSFNDRQRFFVEGFRAAGELIEVQPLPDRDCRQIVNTLLRRADVVPVDFVRVACE